ncbi:MAG: T9SS type A sorting domain-containing protein, partial [Bacteroidetes bacterium]|nr:T9SS type A sorting domain-containing protein [Bacteroidota bacterium]
WAKARIWTDSVTAIDDEKSQLFIPRKLALLGNYPNPFNSSTTISYQLSTAGNVELSIYNVLGQKVRSLVNTNQNAGIYKVVWDGTNETGSIVNSGVYFCRISDGQEQMTRKVILIK